MARRAPRKARSSVRDAVTALVLFGLLLLFLFSRARRAGYSFPPGPTSREPTGRAGSNEAQDWGSGGPNSRARPTPVPPRPVQPVAPGAESFSKPVAPNPQSASKPVAPSPQSASKPVAPGVESLSKPLPVGAESLVGNPHLALGIPTDADPSDDLLMDERAYVVSYNPQRNGPNWASWRLERSHLGSVRRDNHFRADPLLPPLYYHVEPNDYAHSGYDRGHLCPSGDRTRSQSDNAATFLMTNMLPQVHELNAGPWEKLEEYERSLVNQSISELHIVAGGIFGEPVRTIGHGVAVPKALYKIIVRLERGQTPAQVTADTDVLAVIMPNSATAAARPWTDFATTVNEIERQTGYEYFASVPPSVRTALSSRTPHPSLIR